MSKHVTNADKCSDEYLARVVNPWHPCSDFQAWWTIQLILQWNPFAYSTVGEGLECAPSAACVE